MFKNLFLAAVLLCHIALCGAVKIDQSSRQKCSETLMTVICRGDENAFKQLLVPDGFAGTLSMFLELCGLTHKDLIAAMAAELCKELKVDDPQKILNDPALFAKAATMGDDVTFVEKNGKYYIFFSVIDHDSKEHVAAVFMIAMANCDPRTLWEIYTPSRREEVIKRNGSKEAALAVMREVLLEEEKVEITPALLRDEEYFGGIMHGLDGKFIQQKGKWYMKFGSGGQP